MSQQICLLRMNIDDQVCEATSSCANAVCNTPPEGTASPTRENMINRAVNFAIMPYFLLKYGWI
jgi:hypothetical protein